jgi:ferredoxin-NADP reductase
MSVLETFAVRLARSRLIAPDVCHCVFEAQGTERFDFSPGQHVKLSAEIGGVREDRYYSIASAPDGGPRFELCVKINGDPFSQGFARAEGQEFECEGPAGGFGLRGELRDSLLVAAGTGIAPLRAMLLHLLGREDRSGGRKLILLHGARTPGMLLYSEEFADLAKRRPGFEYWPTLSRPGAAWSGRRGRVSAHLEEAAGSLENSFDAYLCGHPEMVAETAQRLTAAGIEGGAVFFEQH